MPNPKPNGRWGFRHLVYFAGLIFMAGGGWFMLQAQADELTDLKQKYATDHDSIVKIQADVQYVKEDVGEIKAEQSAQRQLLTDIFVEVKRGNGT